MTLGYFVCVKSKYPCDHITISDDLISKNNEAYIAMLHRNIARYPFGERGKDQIKNSS